MSMSGGYGDKPAVVDLLARIAEGRAQPPSQRLDVRTDLYVVPDGDRRDVYGDKTVIGEASCTDADVRPVIH